MNYYIATQPNGDSFSLLEKTNWLKPLVTGNSLITAYTSPTVSRYLSWPCRLFRVEPIGKVLTNRYHPERYCGAWRVAEELPASPVLGPQGDNLVRFMDQLTPSNLKAPHFQDAEVHNILRREGLVRSFQAIGPRIQRLTGGSDAAWYAALGLMLRDWLPAETYNTLTRGWRDAYGPLPGDPA